MKPIKPIILNELQWNTLTSWVGCKFTVDDQQIQITFNNSIGSEIRVMYGMYKITSTIYSHQCYYFILYKNLIGTQIIPTTIIKLLREVWNQTKAVNLN